METAARQTIGNLLRAWRTRRRLSQLDLALNAQISTRHLSFIETGRSQPSREMVLHLAEQMAIPLRERNILLTAAGFAPIFPVRSLDDEELVVAKQTIELILRGHEPNPALALDRYWDIISANETVGFLLKDLDSELLAPPVNVLRLSLDPRGLAPKIVNLNQWREHLFNRLRRQIEVTADERLIDLEKELKSFPAPKRKSQPEKVDDSKIAVPIELETEYGRLSLISATTVFGTSVDVLLSEIIVESFFPANQRTAEIIRNNFVLKPQ